MCRDRSAAFLADCNRLQYLKVLHLEKAGEAEERFVLQLYRRTGISTGLRRQASEMRPGSNPGTATKGHGPMSAGNRVKDSSDRLSAGLRFGQSMHALSLALRSQSERTEPNELPPARWQHRAGLQSWRMLKL